MREFNAGNLAQWEQISCGEMIDFTVPEAGFRQVKFDVIADGHVSVRVVTPDQWWLVAAGLGRFAVRFGMAENFAVAIEGDKDTAVFVRTGRELSLIPESITPTHTTVEPRGRHENAEVRRMMLAMRINADRREAMLKAEIARLAASGPAAGPASASAVPDPASAPASAAQPASQPASEGAN